MYDQAIKIDPKFASAYDNKGTANNIITIHRKFAI